MAAFWNRPHAELLEEARGRLALADLLDSLDDREWQVGSLCAGSTVHDVVHSGRTTVPFVVVRSCSCGRVVA